MIEEEIVLMKGIEKKDLEEEVLSQKTIVSIAETLDTGKYI
jgi:hypothetical protein